MSIGWDVGELLADIEAKKARIAELEEKIQLLEKVPDEPPITIKPLNTVALELGKRFFVPVLVKSQCQKCRKLTLLDLTDDYLSYPRTNSPVQLQFTCKACGDSWTHQAILKVTLEAIQ